jgi:hypothetical protein
MVIIAFHLPSNLIFPQKLLLLLGFISGKSEINKKDCNPHFIRPSFIP